MFIIKELGPMTYTFFNKKFDNGVEGHSWFCINIMVSFLDIIFCNLAKTSHPADLEI